MVLKCGGLTIPLRPEPFVLTPRLEPSSHDPLVRPRGAPLLTLATAFAPRAALSQPVQQKIKASDGARKDYFGGSVAVSGDVAIVGADEDDDNGDESGAAYVFRRVGSAWVEEQKLTAPDGSAQDQFAWSVSVSGDVAVVGARGDDDHGFSSGSAYVFRFDGASWVEEQKLTAADGRTYDYFGVAVSVSGDVALVGAEEDDDNGPQSGSAYAFDLTADPLSLAPLAPPVAVPAGGAFDYVAFVPNNGPSPYPFDAWVTVTLPDGSPGGPVVGPFQATLPAHTALVRVLRYDVPAQAPLGTHTLTLNVGAYPTVEDAASFTFEVVQGVATKPDGEGAALASAHPNPTSGRAVVSFALAAPAAVRLALHDVLGREVAVVDAGRLAAGAHRLGLDVTALPAGVYVWRLAAGERVASGRLTVVR